MKELTIIITFGLTVTLSSALHLITRNGHPSRHRVKYGDFAPLISYDYHDDSSPYENTAYRKKYIKEYDGDKLPILIVKNFKFKTPNTLKLKHPHGQKHGTFKGFTGLKRDRPSRNRLDDLFDKNGMIYLTQPKDDDDRSVNKLLNKVVKYKMDEEKHKYLRKPLSAVFSKQEIARLKKMVTAVNADEPPQSEPHKLRTEKLRTVFNFDELVDK